MMGETRIDPYQSRANLNPPNDGKNDYSILKFDYWHQGYTKKCKETRS